MNAPVHAVAMDTNGDGIADQIVAVQGTDGASGEIRTFSPSGVLQSKLTGFKGSWNIAKLRCHEPVACRDRRSSSPSWEHDCRDRRR